MQNLLANFKTDLAKSFPLFLKVFFINNINIEVTINSLFDDFGVNGIVLLFFFDLRDGSRFRSRFIYNILDFFFFKYDLYEIGQMGPILKTSEFFFFTILFIVFICHCNNTGE